MVRGVLLEDLKLFRASLRISIVVKFCSAQRLNKLIFGLSL